MGGQEGKEPEGGLSLPSWIVPFVVMYFLSGRLGLHLELKGLSDLFPKIELLSEKGRQSWLTA